MPLERMRESHPSQSRHKHYQEGDMLEFNWERMSLIGRRDPQQF